MEKTHRYAAIDIGSNAVRLLLSNVVEEHGQIHFKKAEFVRMPLRLGADVFQEGKVSVDKARNLFKTMHAFKLLIDVFSPVDYRACATASLREASNANYILKSIHQKIGLKIDVISGKEEAQLIYTNHVEQLMDPSRAYIYIDVGGGSTEITVFNNNQVVDSQSFPIGTLRWLKGKVSVNEFDEMKRWVKQSCNAYNPITAIGSGGNINKVVKLLDKKDLVVFSKLRDFYLDLKMHTLEERMEIWQLNQDRAEVILPALKIYLTVMKTAGAQLMVVPQIGLVDGIIHYLHEKNLKRL